MNIGPAYCYNEAQSHYLGLHAEGFFSVFQQVV